MKSAPPQAIGEPRGSEEPVYPEPPVEPEGGSRPRWWTYLLVWSIYLALAASLVSTSPAHSLEGMSYLDVAWAVLVRFAGEGISPPIHLLGVPLIVIGVRYATRPWGICAGLLGTLLWVGTGVIMSGLLVT